MTTDVSQYDLDTVVNKSQFTSLVELKNCEKVGQSLVAKATLEPGDIVLVETPLLQYLLEPTCRSSLSPFYSKKIWKTIKEIVQTANPTANVDTIDSESSEEEEEGEDDYDGSRYSDNEDYESDCNSDADRNLNKNKNSSNKIFTSSFIPGVPAAIYAFLQIYPPTTLFANATKSNYFKNISPESFEFFYYPDTTMNHSTVKTICEIAQRVTKEIALFQHIDPDLLSQFILKIYGNAHTVVLDRKANQRQSLAYMTHYKKQHRRKTIYAKKQIKYDSDDNDDDNQDSNIVTNGWKETTGESKPSIALMVWGSKFAHSCSPNLLLQYDPPSNTMMFIATRPIHQGEILTFSYLPEDESLGGLVCGTTESRRTKLQKFKFFECECERCQAEDVCRGTYCPKNCQNNQTKNSFSTSWYQGGLKTWKCENCQSDEIPLFASKEIEKGELYVEKMITGLAAKLRNGESNGGVVDMLEPFLNKLLQREMDTNNNNSEALLPAIPIKHWSFAYIHGLLSIYHLDMFPRIFGKGLASQLGLTTSGFKEAKVYIVDYLHECLWTTNPIPTFFASWNVLEPVIQATLDGTEKKLYILPTSENNNQSNSNNSEMNDNNISSDEEENNDDYNDNEDDDKHKASVNIEKVVIPMPDEWSTLIREMESCIVNKWVPTIKSIFKNRNSVVIDDMLNKIQQWEDRIDKSTALS
ncbi:unnamed protein product [Cunninghamella echinulata]